VILIIYACLENTTSVSISRDGKNRLFFFRKRRNILVCFCLILVGFLVAAVEKKLPLGLLFGLTKNLFFMNLVVLLEKMAYELKCILKL